jgi:hypothetical protein
VQEARGERREVFLVPSIARDPIAPIGGKGSFDFGHFVTFAQDEGFAPSSLFSTLSSLLQHPVKIDLEPRPARRVQSVRNVDAEQPVHERRADAHSREAATLAEVGA